MSKLQMACEKIMAMGFCGAVFYEALAEFMSESGNDEPSSECIDKGIEWSNNPSLMISYIKGSSKWCMRPKYGCINYCHRWKLMGSDTVDNG